MEFAALKKSAAMIKAFAKSGAQSLTLAERRKYYGGPSFGHISQEYLFSSSVFPLGIILQLFGSEGCCKSTLAAAMLDQLFLRQGGEGHLIDTESKVNTDLMASIVDPQAVAEDRFTVDSATIQERAQVVLTAYAKELNRATFGKAHAAHLLGLVLDSFRVASETTADKVVKDGHATKNYATEANLWRTYLGTFMSLLEFAPMSLIIVNHMVEKDSPMGIKVKDSGGGVALKFFETYSVLVTKVKSTTNKSEVFTDLCLTTVKNSNGVAKQKIFPRVVYKHPDFPEGRTVVDWSYADQMLLTGPDVPLAAMKREGICSPKESSTAGRFNDDILGLKGVPFKEITDTLYADTAKLEALRKLLGINTYKNIDQLWEDGWFFGARGGSTAGIEEDDESGEV